MIILVALVIIAIMNIVAFALMGHDKRCARQGKWRVPEKALFLVAACFGRTGRRAGHEGVSSQDAALVLQGGFSGAADRPDCVAGGWRVSADAMKHSAKSGLWRKIGYGFSSD